MTDRASTAPSSPSQMNPNSLPMDPCSITVESTAATITNDHFISASYEYRTTKARQIQSEDGVKRTIVVSPTNVQMTFTTNKTVPKLGVMIVGIGGNNGTTLLAGKLANQHKLKWMTKSGEQSSNWLGSVAMSGATRISLDESTNEEIFVPVRSLLPLVHPDDIVFSGWDISSLPLGEAMARAQVLEYSLQTQLMSEMNEVIPLPAIFNPSFIALNQNGRADNIINGSFKEQLETVRNHIKNFKEANKLDNVIVVWSANTERFACHTVGVHDSAANLLNAIENNHQELAPSCLYAVAAILENCSYINGSPQNTFCDGLVELARQKNVFLAGDDLKTGQTKLKSVLVDFLVSAGIKPMSICSYNHLGNNDGLNLSAPEQFRSKEISKSGVADDMFVGNPIIFAKDEKPDHIIVIKYVPAVGDSKRAIDEYSSKIFMNGNNTIAIHNTCEDSLLAAPIILDLVIFCEMFQRVKVTADGKPQEMDPMLSLLSYWCKAPVVPHGAPVVNALFAQREALVNFMRACVGLPPESFLQLEHRFTK